MPESFGFLRDDPVTTLDIAQLESREESPNDRQYIISDIVTVRATNDKRWAIISMFVRVFEREITHPVKTSSEGFDWNSKLESFRVWRADEVCEKKLPDRKRLE